MKKLISLIAILLFGVATFAQTNTVISRDNNYFEWSGVATADTVGGSTTTWSKPIFLVGQDDLLYYFKVKVTESAGFACTIKLQGKYFDSDTYTDITTKTYTGVGTDTTVVYDEGTTATRYRYLNVLVTRTSGTGKVSFIKMVCKK